MSLFNDTPNTTPDLTQSAGTAIKNELIRCNDLVTWKELPSFYRFQYLSGIFVLIIVLLILLWLTVAEIKYHEQGANKSIIGPEHTWTLYDSSPIWKILWVGAVGGVILNLAWNYNCIYNGGECYKYRSPACDTISILSSQVINGNRNGNRKSKWN